MQFADDSQMVSEGDALSYGQVLRKYMVNFRLRGKRTVLVVCIEKKRERKKLNYLLIGHLINHLTTHVSRPVSMA